MLVPHLGISCVLREPREDLLPQSPQELHARGIEPIGSFAWGYASEMLILRMSWMQH